jgi:hypothetical protein
MVRIIKNQCSGRRETMGGDQAGQPVIDAVEKKQAA